MLMPITTRANAAPADQGNRLLQRLFPGQYGQTPSPFTGTSIPKPQSPTGLPVYTPPPPRPVTATAPQAATAPVAAQAAPQPAAPVNMPGRGISPTAASQSAGILPQAQPQTTGGANPYGLTPEQEAQLNEWWKAQYSGPDYKGRNEANHYLLQQYQQMLESQNREAPIDYSGGAQIGQYYDRARSRQAAMDAAMGRSGGGVGAAGQSSLYGQQGSAVADMVRQLLEQRRQERMKQEDWMRNLTAQVGHEGLQRNWHQQDSPGFFSQLLGTVGSLAGNLIPGIHLGGGNGGNNAEVNTQPLGDMSTFGMAPQQSQEDQIAALMRQAQEPDQLDPFGQYGSR